MLLRVALCLALFACPVMADSPTTRPGQPLRRAADVIAEMRAAERRVASDLSRSGDYAALKAQQAALAAQLDTCDDKDRPTLAAQKFALTQQISAMEKAELAKDEHYPALKSEYDRLAQEAARRPKETQSANASDAPSDPPSGPPAITHYDNDGYHTIRLRIGARKTGLVGAQTFTTQR